jgi:hypothetical protein
MVGERRQRREWQTDLSVRIWAVKLPTRARATDKEIGVGCVLSLTHSDTRIKGCEFILQNGEQYYYCLSPLSLSGRFLFDCARVSSPSPALILIVSLRDRKPKFTYFAILNEYAAVGARCQFLMSQRVGGWLRELASGRAGGLLFLHL